jgi:3-hydroxyisobutyrate dehydrogenase-like beta-hydroxyacid dehydrogenase
MKVSIVGLGNMGAAIATRLLDAGHDLAVWNRTETVATPFAERGASVLSHPDGAWQHGEAAIAMLANDEAVEEVLTGTHGS